MMYKLVKQLSLFFLFWSAYTGNIALYAQEITAPPGFRFENFALPGGELGNHVQTIVQDSSGFLWFGSQYGLHRWDGYQFKTYLTNALDAGSISSNYVEYICVGKDGTLWIGTWGGGLNHFDPRTQKFTPYLHHSRDPESLSNNYVTKIIEDRQGYIWVSTQYGVSRLDRKTGKFKRFVHNPEDPSSLSYDKCRTLFQDATGTIWVGTGWPWEDSNAGGLNRYLPQSETFTRYLHDPTDPNSLANNKIVEINEDSKGNLWIGTAGDGLHLMDTKTGSFTRLANKPGAQNKLSAPLIRPFFDWHTRFVFEDRQKKLWIGSWRGGIKYYDPATGYIKHYKYEGKGAESVPDNFVWMMFQSKDGTRWGCTAGPGGQVFKIVEEKSVFGYLGMNKEDYAQSFCETQSGDFWVGTKSKGLIRIDFETGEGVSYRNDPHHAEPVELDHEADQFDNENKQLFDNICKIHEDKKGNLWMGKWLQDAGLMRFNPATSDFKVYHHNPLDRNSLASNMIMDILEDKKGRLWIATANGDLNRYDPDIDGFVRYAALNKSPLTVQYPSKNVFFPKLTLARDGAIWIGGSGGDKANVPLSLARFDPETAAIQFFNLKLTPDESAIPEWVNGLEEDEDGNIWLNTEFALRKINPKSGVSTTYGAQYLGSSVLRSMVMDAQGRLWLSGEGLIVFNPLNGTSFNYHTASGIKTIPFQWRSAYKNAKGHLFFGGRSGFHHFNPEEIGNTQATPAPEVLITDFNLFDKSVSPGEKGLFFTNIWESNEIRLSHNQDVFTFRFACLDFLYPEGNRHKFILEGYDQDWRIAGIEPIASYVKVPPGTYTFRVRAANRNGVWGEEKTIRVIILPPWWATWWAYSFYVALILAVLYAFYRVQLHRKLEQAEALRLKELDVVKTRLYTNITHEFRTPLTIILGMARQALDHPDRQPHDGLEMIMRNGQHLLGLVNQMLDLAKLESGKMSLHLQQGDIVNYLKYLTESFHSFAQSRGVQIHFLSDLEALTMDYDPERMQQIFSNLLSNAVKFTPAGGHVYVAINVQVEGNFGKKLFIKIKDTGIGISEEHLPNIFDRFTQIDDSHTRQSEGSGIGLALTKELVKLMDGEINARSQAGQGAEFTVSLPVEAIENTAPANPLHWIAPKRPEQLAPAPGRYPVPIPIPLSENRTTILLAEDNPDVVAYLASCLAGDYRLVVARDGREAIDIATEHTPDLIVTDVMMPYTDGYEVCRTLRKDERTSHIPIIMLTAKADVESKLEGLEYGADAYLAKPFHKKELLVRIRKLLELRVQLRRHYLTVAGLADGTTVRKDIPAVPDMEDQFIIKIRKTVEAHIDDSNFDVERLCREMAMSHSQLHRKLTALTGFSATKFIRYVKLNKAKELLQNQALSITAVAFDAGFNDPSYFGRVFRQEFGVSPQEWRSSPDVGRIFNSPALRVE
jgi:signal transduction histidine kinase/DNA-binding response OmpR family regulator/ligand-binding sensor domain-containing protein